YYCQLCYEKYKCKKPISDKKRNEREQQSEQSNGTNICSEYKLCKTKHWPCCEKNGCNNG
ncbi:1968_t:CDS:1, partial [Scutellospora calospora]